MSRRRNDLMVIEKPNGELVMAKRQRPRQRPRPRPRNDGHTSLGDLAKLLMAAAALKAAGGTNGPLVITHTRTWSRGMEDEED